MKKQNTKIKLSQPQNEFQKSENSLQFWVSALLLSLICGVTYLVYASALKFGFLWDDDLYISQNTHIEHLNWESIKLIFTSFYVGNYQPISILSYAVEYSFVGRTAWLYHFDNLILHLLNTVLVFRFVQLLSSKRTEIALVVAAFFAVHPMHVESVAWVSERKDLMYTFFFLLSLLFYLHYSRSKKTQVLILSGLFFVLSCMSKSAAIILPLVLLIIDFYVLEKFSWRQLIEKLPFLFISILFGVVALYSQKDAGAIANLASHSFVDRFCFVAYSFDSYLLKAFIPFDLSAVYPYPIKQNGILPFYYYLAPIGLGVLLISVWRSLKWDKVGIFGFLFFGINLALVLQFVPLGNVMMSDRYTYVPYIGVFFVLGKLYNFPEKINAKLLTICFLTLFSFYTYACVQRVKVWKNEETLFGDAVEKGYQSPAAYHNLAFHQLYITALKKYESDPASKMEFVAKAEANFSRAILLVSDISYFHRAYARAILGNHMGAVQDYSMTIEKFPNNIEAYYNRGLSKNELKDFTGAISDYDHVILLDTNRFEPYYNRGIANRALGNTEAAMTDYNKAIDVNPNYFGAYNNRGFIQTQLHDYQRAYKDFKKASELNPQDANAARNRDLAKSFLDSKSRK